MSLVCELCSGVRTVQKLACVKNITGGKFQKTLYFTDLENPGNFNPWNLRGFSLSLWESNFTETVVCFTDPFS